MNNFAKNLRTLRENRGLNQEDMLASIGFARARWSSYETGAARPNIDDLIKIAAFFNTTETEILHSDIPIQGIQVVKGGIDDGRKRLKHPSKNTDDVALLKQLIKYQEEKIAELKKQLKEYTNK